MRGIAVCRLNCRRSLLRWGCAGALPIPDRADDCSGHGVGSGVRLLPGGIQRRAAGARAGLPRRCQIVRHGDSAAGDHGRQGHSRTWVVGRGTQRGIGAVGQRLTAGISELSRFVQREAQGAKGRPAKIQVEEESPAVVSADPQRVPNPTQWTVVCCKARRAAGALVSRAAKPAVECHDHSRAERALLRQLRRQCAGGTFASGAARSWPGCGDRAVGDDRRYRRSTHRLGEPKASAAQVAETSALGTAEVAATEGVQQPQRSGDGAQQASGTSYLRWGVGAVHADHPREGGEIRPHHAADFPVAPVEQGLQHVRTPARRAAPAHAGVDVSGMPDSSRPRPQRRQEHPRRRAGGETKRLRSLGRSSCRGGSRR